MIQVEAAGDRCRPHIKLGFLDRPVPSIVDKLVDRVHSYLFDPAVWLQLVEGAHPVLLR